MARLMSSTNRADDELFPDGLEPASRLLPRGDGGRDQANGSEGREGEDDDQGWHGPIFAGPANPQPFAEPEGAERRQQHADDELQRVLRDLRQGAVHGDAQGHDERQRGRGAEARGEEQSVSAGADGDDDEDHLGALDHRDLE